MGLDKSGLTFHAFRRTGATLGCAQKVPLQATRAHGAWDSDTVRQYIKHIYQAMAIVLLGLGQLTYLCSVPLVINMYKARIKEGVYHLLYKHGPNECATLMANVRGVIKRGNLLR